MAEAPSVMVVVERAEAPGMVLLRGDLADPALGAAVERTTGQAVPPRRGIALADGRGVAWMAPDELLLFVPRGEAAAAVAALEAALAGRHVLAADVSDLRVAFRLRGPGAREAVARLCPVDMAPEAFPPGTIRRTRAAQVAAAIWMSGPEEVTLLAPRSVADYAAAILAGAARPGAAAGLFRHAAMRAVPPEPPPPEAPPPEPPPPGDARPAAAPADPAPAPRPPARRRRRAEGG